MIADAHFAIGRSHMVCQDYARSGAIESRPFAIVSDGCSSSPDTDFGARLLTMAAVQCLRTLEWSENVAEKWIIRQARDRVPAGISPYCLDATLLVAYERTDGRIHALAFGDGVLVARRWSGVIETWEIDFGSVPGYLSYLLNAERLRHYLDEGHGQRVVTHRIGGDVAESEQAQVSADAGMRWETFFDPKEFDLIMWLSDGALSFQNSVTMASVPLVDVVAHATDIRARKGEFLKRSHRFFLTKTCPKLGWQHTDDFGAAALLVEGAAP